MVGEVLTEESEPPTATQIFEEQCPYYMAMGMSVSEFWDGDPMLVVYYRKAHEIQQELINVWEWRMGVYNLYAFGTIIGSMFAKNKDDMPDYLKEPLPLREKTEEEKEAERQAEIKAQNDRFAELLERNMIRFNSAKEQENGNG